MIDLCLHGSLDKMPIRCYGAKQELLSADNLPERCQLHNWIREQLLGPITLITLAFLPEPYAEEQLKGITRAEHQKCRSDKSGMKQEQPAQEAPLDILQASRRARLFYDTYSAETRGVSDARGPRLERT